MLEKLRLLQVEDSESDAALIIRHLEKSGYQVYSERVQDEEPMRQALNRLDWEVIISDYQLPQFDAGDALRIRNECARDVPFIVVSGTIGEDQAVEMMRAGAQDYVLKDRISRLAPAVRRAVKEARAYREHRTVEAQLHDRDAWLALAVQATKLGTFDFRPDSDRWTLSETCRRHAGLPLDCPISHENVIAAMHPADRARLAELFRKALDPAAGGEFIADCRTISCDDQVECWVAIQGQIFFDAAGQPLRFVGVTQDITERKQLEARLTTLDHAKTDFLNLISHEFRTPLNGILGVGDLLLEQLPERARDQELRGLFQRCRRRILSILDDALLLAQINVEDEKFKCCSVSLHIALLGAIQKATDFANSRNVAFSAPSSIPNLVWANEESLVRALQALLEASVKFSEAGRTVLISCSASSHSLKITMETFGRTVPDASLAKFFEIFSIGEAIVPGGDLGLGPAVACRILSLFGASVDVENLDPPGIRLSISLKDSTTYVPSPNPQLPVKHAAPAFLEMR
jgi:signal transduction histidine kinase/DNA-binding NarL/FixJ family response regulator